MTEPEATPGQLAVGCFLLTTIGGGVALALLFAAVRVVRWAWGP